MSFLIAPSLLAADPLSLADSVEALKGKHDWLHMDIMDGHFVRNFSFGTDVVRAMRRRWPDEFIDVHLMTDRLETALPLFMEHKPSQVTIHAETEPQLMHAALLRIKEAGIKAGVAIGPATPVGAILPVLGIADLVLVMSVTPGFGGQTLIEDTLEKTRDLARIRAARGYSYLIEMDGGLCEDNAAKVVLAGCDVLVMGSAVFGSSDPAACIDRIKLKVKEALAYAGLG